MSYLDTPRIHIAGRFFTDPSTMNNDPAHYDPDCTKPSPWQEPKGNHYFRLVDCTVRSALNAAGQPANDDPIIGVNFQSVDTFPDSKFPNKSPAKIVDLDVYQQGVSTIYGLRLQLINDALSFFYGTMDPARLNGVWFTAVLPTRGWDQDYGWSSYGGDANACGTFQSVIRVAEDKWTKGKSPVVDQLYEACAQVTGQDGKKFRLISFKFILDGYDNVATHESFEHGRFTGAIGPYREHEPVSVPAGNRWLNARAMPSNPAWYVPAFYSASFILDQTRKRLVIDLGNSICRQTVGGPPVDLGTLSAVVLNADPLAAPTVLGTVDYSQFAYENNAGLAEVPLTDAQLKLVKSAPLSLVTSRADIGAQLLFSEDPSGLAYAVDNRVLRMTSEPSSIWQEVSSQVYFTQWGVPAAGKQFQLLVQPVKGSSPNATVPPNYPGDNFNADGALQSALGPSDEYGLATIRLKSVKDPGSRTSQLDGQLYFIYPCPDPGNPSPSTYNQERLLSVLMFSSYPVNQTPTWEDVRTLMVPYAKLFPAMTQRIDLTDLHTFTIFADNPPWQFVYFTPAGYNVLGISQGAIPFYMSRDFDDPRLMPLTRDLSPNKVTTILYFCKILQSQLTPPGGQS
jgi:hypothetical protein